MPEYSPGTAFLIIQHPFMKTLASIALCMLLLCADEHPMTANACYDFSDSIVQKISREPGTVVDGAISQALAISGYYDGAMTYEPLDSAQNKIYLDGKQWHTVDARSYILDKAANYDLLMINEAHNRPQHRLFTKSLLKDLYAKGYRVLFAEGIWDDENINRKGYPLDTDGRLLSDPSYASMLRYAKRLGYYVAAYEYKQPAKKSYWDDSAKVDSRGSMRYISYNPPDTFTRRILPNGDTMYEVTSIRERTQAKNIYDIMQAHKGEKCIVHVGYGHINEDGAMMAYHLRKLMNWKPFLRVEQTTLDDRKEYIGSNVKLPARKPIFLADSSGDFFVTPSITANCLEMINASVRDSLMRPGYLFEDVEKRYVYRLPKEQVGQGDCVFAAYPLQEYNAEHEHAIAVDVVYAKTAQTVPPMLLYKGKYAVLKKTRQHGYERFDVEVK